MLIVIFITFLVGATLAWVIAMELSHRKVNTMQADINKLKHDRNYLRNALNKSQAAYKALMHQYRQLQARLGATLESHREQLTSMHWEIVKTKEEAATLRNQLAYSEGYSSAPRRSAGYTALAPVTVTPEQRPNVALRELQRTELEQRSTIRKLREQLLELKAENALVLATMQVPSDISVASRM